MRKKEEMVRIKIINNNMKGIDYVVTKTECTSL